MSKVKKTRCCPECDGEGTDYRGRDCEECGGTGEDSSNHKSAKKKFRAWSNAKDEEIDPLYGESHK